MAGDALFDLPGTQTMASDIDHVIGTSEDEVIAVIISYAPVKGRVHLLGAEIRPVGFDEALIIIKHGLQATGRQRPFDHQHTFLIIAAQRASVFIQQLEFVARHGDARAAESGRFVLDTFCNRQDGPASLSLPVVVNDGHAQLTSNPRRRRLIQRLAGQIQCLQRGQIMFFK